MTTLTEDKRIISKGALSRFMPKTIYQWAAILIFLVVSSAVTYWGRDEGSAWIKLSQPTTPMNSSDGLLGYCFIVHDTVFYLENGLFYDQMHMFNGAPFSTTIVLSRAFYAFLASLVAPFLGNIHALQTVNYLCWVFAAWAAWRMARRMFKDELAALIAVALVAGGFGFTMHINDFSAHIISFAMFYMGIMIIYESGVWEKSCSLRTHLAISFYIVLANLTYNIGLPLAAGYLIVAARRNRWRDIIISALVIFSSRPIWNMYFNWIHHIINTADWRFDVYNPEKSCLGLSLSIWIGIIKTGAAACIKKLSMITASFLCFDSPATVFLGLASIFIVVKNSSLRFFFAVFIVLVFAAAVVWFPISTCRGYIVYGISILFYIALAGWLASQLRKKSLWRIVWICVTMMLLAVHFFWSTSYLYNLHAPMKIYFFGFDQEDRDAGTNSLLKNPAKIFTYKPEVMSLTGLEPVPRLFGGNAGLTDAGIYNPHPDQPRPSTIKGALWAKGLFGAYVCLFLYFAVPNRRLRMFSISGMVFMIIISSVFSGRACRKIPEFYFFYNAIEVPVDYTARYEVKVSDTFIDELRRQAAPGDMVEIVENRSALCNEQNVKVFIGEREIAPGRSTAQIIWEGAADPIEVMSAFNESNILRIEVDRNESNKSGFIAGWQRNGLAGRSFELIPRHPSASSQKIIPQALPYLEVRLRDKEGWLKLAGF